MAERRPALTRDPSHILARCDASLFTIAEKAEDALTMAFASLLPSASAACFSESSPAASSWKRTSASFCADAVAMRASFSA